METKTDQTFLCLTQVLFSFHPVGLFICIQAGAVPAIRRLLHVCPTEGATQPVSPAGQNTRGLHLPTKLDHGQGDAQPRAGHDLPQQGLVCCPHPCYLTFEMTGCSASCYHVIMQRRSFIRVLSCYVYVKYLKFSAVVQIIFTSKVY